jgi:hypothetical protein
MVRGYVQDETDEEDMMWFVRKGGWVLGGGYVAAH